MFNEFIVKSYPEDPLANCRNITLQVTNDCCLNCSYCYQINKGHEMMTKETSKKIIDLLFNMYDENKEDNFINHHTKGIILEFIGGEPFMNIEVVAYASQYFIDECIKRKHIWLTNSRFSISSNGILYFNPEVQIYLKKFKDFINLNITIDGPKELHDNCRKDYSGNGSFDQAILAFDDWAKKASCVSTKVTIAPENLAQISAIVSFFYSRGGENIDITPINEHKWTINESQIYYEQLKIIANNLLKYKTISTNLFNSSYGLPLDETQENNWCGGTGAMLSFDPNGIAYPCIRYMSSSLGDTVPPIIIGDVNGIYISKEAKEIKKQFDAITRRTQSSDECYYCSVASGCAWCSAWNYQEFGTPNKRSTNICWMHRARSLVNVYYLNNYYIIHNINKSQPLLLDKNIALQIINEEEYNNLIKLSQR